MMRRPDVMMWRLDRVDKFARSVVLTRRGSDEFTVEIEPSSQRDEGERMVGIARQFWVEIVADRIMLRRQQSVSGVLIIPAGSSGLADQYGVLTHHIDDRIGSGSSVRRGAAGQCNITNTVDYTSTYTGTIIVTPVNYRGPDV